MPIHDWTRVDAGLFHDFHQDWTIELRRSLNAGRLPSGYTALTDQPIGGTISDVLSQRRSAENGYAERANRIRIHRRRGELVAAIEIVCPGNKNSRGALKSFVRKAADLILQGINLLVVDLFPPCDRDQRGIHQAIWDELAGQTLLPNDKPLTVAAYVAGPPKLAYVEPVTVGDALPTLPIFLTDDVYVPAPLEETYSASWAMFPADFKGLLEPPY